MWYTVPNIHTDKGMIEPRHVPYVIAAFREIVEWSLLGAVLVFIADGIAGVTVTVEVAMAALTMMLLIKETRLIKYANE